MTTKDAEHFVNLKDFFPRRTFLALLQQLVTMGRIKAKRSISNISSKLSIRYFWNKSFRELLTSLIFSFKQILTSCPKLKSKRDMISKLSPRGSHGSCCIRNERNYVNVRMCPHRKILFLFAMHKIAILSHYLVSDSPQRVWSCPTLDFLFGAS